MKAKIILLTGNKNLALETFRNAVNVLPTIAAESKKRIRNKIRKIENEINNKENNLSPSSHPSTRRMEKRVFERVENVVKESSEPKRSSSPKKKRQRNLRSSDPVELALVKERIRQDFDHIIVSR